MRPKKSKIWMIPDDEFKQLVASATSSTEILNYFGLENKGGNNRTLWERFDALGIDRQPLLEKGRKAQIEALRRSQIALENEKVFVENSNYSRMHLKKRIIKQNLIPHACQKCGLKDTWQNEPIVLHLEHINGVSNDNRIENLCFLCPNCHSQTRTYAGKKNKA